MKAENRFAENEFPLNPHTLKAATTVTEKVTQKMQYRSKPIKQFVKYVNATTEKFNLNRVIAGTGIQSAAQVNLTPKMIDTYYFSCRVVYFELLSVHRFFYNEETNNNLNLFFLLKTLIMPENLFPDRTKIWLYFNLPV